ncbi:MAG TPA: FadR/GntR family transcriptional regulator [Sphingomonas sp.]|nr:FadR/GntR family transcriptional regulator [Sphingomonas sp.]
MNAGARKLYQRISDAIAGAIRDGHFAPGARLPSERDLAEEYGVSRPTIREAMIALEIRGLVEARHGSGIYVTDAPETAGGPAELDVGAFELTEARLLFEAEAAALAATVIEPDVIDRLEATLDAMAAEEPGSPAAFQADRAFHLLIAEATENSLVRSVVAMLWTVRENSPLCAHIFAKARREGVLPRVDEHRLILDALRARNPQAAREAMRKHLRRVIDDLLAATEVDLLERARSEAREHRSRIAQREIP